MREVNKEELIKEIKNTKKAAKVEKRDIIKEYKTKKYEIIKRQNNKRNIYGFQTFWND